MAESEKDFVRRWSQRKTAERTAGEPLAPEGPLPAEAAQEAALPAEAPDNLPDIDTLDESSDFTVFLKKGVPDIIRRKALRKLWRLHPAMAVIDGLDDYDEDFTDAATVIEGMKTLYKAGKGYADEEPAEEPAEAEGEEVAESDTESETGEAESETGEAESETGEAESETGEAESETESESENVQSVPDGKEKSTLVTDAKPAIPVGRQAANDGEAGASAHAAQTHGRSARQRRWGQVVDK